MSKNGRILTPTEQRMFDLLSDGQFHSKVELHECLPDELGMLTNIAIHIHNIRKKLPVGYILICEVNQRQQRGYRLARLLPSANDGMT